MSEQKSSYPPRRVLRESPTQRAPRHRRVVSRITILAALGALTVAAPLSGFVGSNMSLTSPGRVVAAGSDQASWVETEAALPLNHALGLDNDPGAETRARLNSDPLSACIAAESANGARLSQAPQDVVRWPLAKGSYRQSSPFGYRVHPILGVGKLHEGVDLSAPSGTPIYAVADGVVSDTSAYGGGGNRVQIKHIIEGKTVYSQYLHILGGSIKVKEGQKVESGQIIAGVGSTGFSTGPHLHFEIRPTVDKAIDPIAWLKKNRAVYAGEECQ